MTKPIATVGSNNACVEAMTAQMEGGVCRAVDENELDDIKANLNSRFHPPHGGGARETLVIGGQRVIFGENGEDVLDTITNHLVGQGVTRGEANFVAMKLGSKGFRDMEQHGVQQVFTKAHTAHSNKPGRMVLVGAIDRKPGVTRIDVHNNNDGSSRVNIERQSWWHVGEVVPPLGQTMWSHAPAAEDRKSYSAVECKAKVCLHVSPDSGDTKYNVTADLKPFDGCDELFQEPARKTSLAGTLIEALKDILSTLFGHGNLDPDLSTGRDGLHAESPDRPLPLKGWPTSRISVVRDSGNVVSRSFVRQPEPAARLSNRDDSAAGNPQYPGAIGDGANVFDDTGLNDEVGVGHVEDIARMVGAESGVSAARNEEQDARASDPSSSRNLTSSARTSSDSDGLAAPHSAKTGADTTIGRSSMEPPAMTDHGQPESKQRPEGMPQRDHPAADRARAQGATTEVTSELPGAQRAATNTGSAKAERHASHQNAAAAGPYSELLRHGNVMLVRDFPGFENLPHSINGAMTDVLERLKSPDRKDFAMKNSMAIYQLVFAGQTYPQLYSAELAKQIASAYQESLPADLRNAAEELGKRNNAKYFALPSDDGQAALLLSHKHFDNLTSNEAPQQRAADLSWEKIPAYRRDSDGRYSAEQVISSETLDKFPLLVAKYYSSPVTDRSDHLRPALGLDLKLMENSARLQPKNEAQRKLVAQITEECETLYQTENIIGYTQGGGPQQPPSVYYRTNDGFVGRITQDHTKPGNIGRERPILNRGYVAGNTGPIGQYFEVFPGDGVHFSRGDLKPVDSEEQRMELSKAQEAFPFIKLGHRGQLTK